MSRSRPMSNELNFSYFKHESYKRLILILHMAHEIEELGVTREQSKRYSYGRTERGFMRLCRA